jgi:hypothetical protein
MSETHPTDFAARLELAWAAGFFDGEGCTILDVQRSGFSYVRLCIKQVVRENLERFMAAVGGVGTLNGPYQKVENAQPISRYRVSGTGAREALKLLWPYLGEAKRQQAARALAGEVNKGGVLPAKRTHCPNGHAYDAENTRFGRDGRKCRKCDAEAQRRRRKTDKPHSRARTHCPQGHAYQEHGFLNCNGRRVCRICSAAAQRRYQERRKAQTEGS